MRRINIGNNTTVNADYMRNKLHITDDNGDTISIDDLYWWQIARIKNTLAVNDILEVDEDEDEVDPWDAYAQYYDD
jgi:hypothetical protein